MPDGLTPDLFTKRVRRAPDPAEFEIHATIVRIVKASVMPSWVWWHTPNGGERPAIISKRGKRISVEGGRLQRLGTRVGVSDLVFASPPNARLHALEIKTRLGQPTDEQKKFLADVKAIGGKVAVVHSVAEAVDVLREWGAIRSSLGA